MLKHGMMLHSMESPRIGHNLVNDQQQRFNIRKKKKSNHAELSPIFPMQLSVKKLADP